MLGNIDAAIHQRRRVKEENLAAVRAAIAAMQRRGLPREAITVKAVAEESGVAAKTIYRRDDTFALVHRANPQVDRQPSAARHAAALEAVEHERDAAREAAAYHQQVAAVGERADLQARGQVPALRRQVLELQAERKRLLAQLARCTCGAAQEGEILPR